MSDGRIPSHTVALETSPDGVRRLGDAQLLGRFLGDRDEASFEAIVLRHGPRVLGVCRKVLGRSSEVEDAFQSTFVLLARKAGSIRNRDALGAWLHGAAHRIAVRSRSKSRRRAIFETRQTQPPSEPRESDLEVQDVQQILHEEIDRLPVRLRQTVLLCYLNEHTNESAARMLECPISTVKDRLARAREILKGRLSRRGVALTAILLLLLMRGSLEAEPVPIRLHKATVVAARKAIRRPRWPRPWIRSRPGPFRPATVALVSSVLISSVVVAVLALPRPARSNWIWNLIEAVRRACR